MQIPDEALSEKHVFAKTRSPEWFLAACTSGTVAAERYPRPDTSVPIGEVTDYE
jgi:hypothetical protein